MLLQPALVANPPTTQDLRRYEEQCFSYYSGSAGNDLLAELESVLALIVKARRELHRTLTERKADEAHQTVTQLLHLEAQAAALRRLAGDIARPPPSGPQDRRPQRRRTARE